MRQKEGRNMRKYTRIGTLLLALVMCLTMLTVQAESELPEEVRTCSP